MAPFADWLTWLQPLVYPGLVCLPLCHPLPLIAWPFASPPIPQKNKPMGWCGQPRVSYCSRIVNESKGVVMVLLLWFQTKRNQKWGGNYLGYLLVSIKQDKGSIKKLLLANWCKDVNVFLKVSISIPFNSPEIGGLLLVFQSGRISPLWV